MEEITNKVKSLKKSKVSGKIAKRMKEFEKTGKQPSKGWFSELCFCLLTANSKAKTALEIEKEIGVSGFCSYSYENVRDCIKKNKHRFHNNKAYYICLARKHMDIKKKLTSVEKSSGELEARDWLAKNIKGLGLKEASHFMRNVGYKNIAIVDRHIINILSENGLVQPTKSITKKNYLAIEKKLESIAIDTGLSLAELDLYLWYLKTGEVLK